MASDDPSLHRQATAPVDQVAVEFSRVSKSFYGVSVLESVSFCIGVGRVVGLVGENGAGKSTLMNILGGVQRPSSGSVILFGESFSPRRPTEATRRGVAFIHQELNLFFNLSIAENFFITRFPAQAGGLLISRSRTQAQARKLLNRVGLSLSPDTHVEQLSPGERQLVEVAKALRQDPRVIIFDEPTTSLTTRETAHLFRLIGQLRRQQIAVIYISHVLKDVFQLCDDLVVLRDGRVAAKGATTEFTEESLITAMVGRTIAQLYPSRAEVPPGKPILEVEALSRPGIVKDINFKLHSGEVLGVAGLMGAGRSELARILFGLDPAGQGTVRLNGQDLGTRTPRHCIRHGLAFLTEDRRAEGLCAEASIGDNMALVGLSDYARGPGRFIRQTELRKAIDRLRDAVQLTESARTSQSVRTLSGGNQQKVVFAKWLLKDPRLFILDEPTRGIDVGAKYEIYRLINELAERGAGLLLISSEIDELMGMCDRVLVMSDGMIRDTVLRREFSRERLLRSALRDSRQAEVHP